MELNYHLKSRNKIKASWQFKNPPVHGEVDSIKQQLFKRFGFAPVFIVEGCDVCLEIETDDDVDLILLVDTICWKQPYKTKVLDYSVV